MTCIFFFSSRRRHTRYWRDWSSDVCSSDLDHIALDDTVRTPVVGESYGVDLSAVVPEHRNTVGHQSLAVDLAAGGLDSRSEERRVGKECRSRWSPYH